MSKRYSIKITYPSGLIAYMDHKGKSQWCLRSAKKHLKEWVHLHGISAELEEEFEVDIYDAVYTGEE